MASSHFFHINPDFTTPFYNPNFTILIYNPDFRPRFYNPDLEPRFYNPILEYPIFRTQFYKIDYPWEWRGAVHEVLLTKKDKDGNPLAPPPRGGRVEGITVLVTPDGNSWGDGSRETQQKKYGDHGELLLEYIKTDSDVRWLFYLAQSYRDSFNWPKAEEWYQKRADNAEGYWEERYFSQLMVASMKANQRKPVAEILEAYSQRSKYDQNRCEHFIPITKHHQATGNWPYAYMISKYVFDNYKKNPFPVSSLFIDKNIYDWIILDIHSLACYWMGRFDEGRKAYNKLRDAINKGLVPETEVKRIKDNSQWFTKAHQQEREKAFSDARSNQKPMEVVKL